MAHVPTMQWAIPTPDELQIYPHTAQPTEAAVLYLVEGNTTVGSDTRRWSFFAGPGGYWAVDAAGGIPAQWQTLHRPTPLTPNNHAPEGISRRGVVPTPPAHLAYRYPAGGDFDSCAASGIFHWRRHQGFHSPSARVVDVVDDGAQAKGWLFDDGGTHYCALAIPSLFPFMLYADAVNTSEASDGATACGEPGPAAVHRVTSVLTWYNGYRQFRSFHTTAEAEKANYSLMEDAINTFMPPAGDQSPRPAHMCEHATAICHCAQPNEWSCSV